MNQYDFHGQRGNRQRQRVMLGNREIQPKDVVEVRDDGSWDLGRNEMNERFEIHEKG